MQVGGNPRIPVYNGTAAEMAAKTGMIEGDLFYTTDTKLLFTYDGAAWNDVLSGVTQAMVNLGTYEVTGASAASIDISGLTTTIYKAIIVTGAIKPVAAGTQQLNMQINNATGGSDYTYCKILDAVVTTGNAASLPVGVGVNNGWGNINVVIDNSNTTANRSVISNCIHRDHFLQGGGQCNTITDKVNEVKIFWASGNCEIGSTMTIWGVK